MDSFFRSLRFSSHFFCAHPVVFLCVLCALYKESSYEYLCNWAWQSLYCFFFPVSPSLPALYKSLIELNEMGWAFASCASNFYSWQINTFREKHIWLLCLLYGQILAVRKPCVCLCAFFSTGCLWNKLDTCWLVVEYKWRNKESAIYPGYDLCFFL